MKVAALIATNNRKQMVSDLLEDCMAQSRKPDSIIVVDNGSEDGTPDHVRNTFPSVQLIELPRNNGYFESLEIGINTALQQGYDAVWSVDDDARLRKDTFEQLINAIDSHDELRDSLVWCANLSPEGNFFTEPVCVNKDGEWKVYHELLPEINDGVYETNGGPNIGVYIPRAVIEKVGPPRQEMTFNGYQEFIFRVQKAGFKLFRCFSSVVYHKRFKFFEVNFMGRTRYVCYSSPWRIYYEIRNIVYVDRTYKRRSLLKSIFNVAIISTVKIYNCEGKITAIVNVFRGFFDGLFGRMGMRVHIPRQLPDKKEDKG